MTAGVATGTLKRSQEMMVDGVRIVWPLLDSDERMQWVSRIKHLFGDDYEETVAVLLPTVFPPAPRGYKRKIHRAIYERAYCNVTNVAGDPVLTNDADKVTCGVCRRVTERHVEWELIGLSRSRFSMARFLHSRGE